MILSLYTYKKELQVKRNFYFKIIILLKHDTQYFAEKTHSEGRNKLLEKITIDIILNRKCSVPPTILLESIVYRNSSDLSS